MRPYFAENVAKLTTENFYIGEISLVALLSYIDYRFPHENWLATIPNLKKWYDHVSALPLFKETAPKK